MLRRSWLLAALFLLPHAQATAADPTPDCQYWCAQADIGRFLAEVQGSACALDAPCQDGLPAVNLAALNGNLEAVTRLLDAGAAVDTRGPSLSTPLHAAAVNGHDDVVRLLLSRGSVVDPESYGRTTPLMLAAEKGRLSTARILVEASARIDALDAKGHTVLGGAVASHEAPLVTFLLERSEPHTPEKLGSLLLVATAGNDPATMRILLDHGASPGARWPDDGATALMIAAHNGHVEATAFLADRKAPLGATDKAGKTALHHALEAEHPDVAAILIRAGAPIQVKDADGETPLLLAEDPITVRSLVQRGADVNASNVLGATALLRASVRGDLESLEILLGKGATVDTCTRWGMSPLSVAYAGGYLRVATRLLEAGANPAFKTEGTCQRPKQAAQASP